MSALMQALCAVCGARAVIVWLYRTTAGVIVDRDALCERHKGEL